MLVRDETQTGLATEIRMFRRGHGCWRASYSLPHNGSSMLRLLVTRTLPSMGTPLLGLLAGMAAGSSCYSSATSTATRSAEG
jgi:hypothetical protein